MEASQFLMHTSTQMSSVGKLLLFSQLSQYFFGSLVQLILFSIYLIFTDLNAVIYFLIGFLVLVIPATYLTKQGRKYAHNIYTITKN